MDRRKFITGTPAVGAAALVGITAANPKRLFGEPASIAPLAPSTDAALKMVDPLLPSLFRLHTAIEGHPEVYNNSRLASMRLALSMIHNETVANEFLQDPEACYNKIGISSSVISQNAAEYSTIAALASPAVREAVATGNATAFLNAMTAATSASANSPALRPPPPISGGGGGGGSRNVNVLVNVNVGVNVTIAVNLFVVVGAFVSVIVAAFAFIASPVPHRDVEVASALGGSSFASDVAALKAKTMFTELMDDIESGAAALPEGVSKAEVLSNMQTLLERHMALSS